VAGISEQGVRVGFGGSGEGVTSYHTSVRPNYGIQPLPPPCHITHTHTHTRQRLTPPHIPRLVSYLGGVEGDVGRVHDHFHDGADAGKVDAVAREGDHHGGDMVEEHWLRILSSLFEKDQGNDRGSVAARVEEVPGACGWMNR